ncbi:MAG: hypothetical protein WD739_07460 [Actinomycetota bacterium]
MKRGLITALTAVLILAGMTTVRGAETTDAAPSPSSVAPATTIEQTAAAPNDDGSQTWTDHQKAECRLSRNGRMNDDETRATIRCFVRQNGGPLRSLFRVCERESHCKAYASNKSSTAEGTYQWLVASYAGARKQLRKFARRWDLGRSRLNPRANIGLAVEVIDRHGVCSHWCAA